MTATSVPDLLDPVLHGDARLWESWAAIKAGERSYAAHSLRCYPCPGHQQVSEPCDGGWHSDCAVCRCTCHGRQIRDRWAA